MNDIDIAGSDGAGPRFNAEDLVVRLVSEFGYPPTQAPQVALKLVNADARIKRDFWHWWQTGRLDSNLSFEGYTVASLIADYRMKVVGAFLTLDWLYREPDVASAALKRGYDRIVLSK
jgi:hypothetical protein